MNRIKNLIVVLISIIIVLSFSGCQLITKTQQGIDNTVVAKINNATITKAEFNKKFQPQLEQYNQMYGSTFSTDPNNKETIQNLKTQFLDSLVQNELVLQEAATLKLVPDNKTLTDEINKQYQDNIDQNYNKNEDDFKAALKKMGISVDDYKEMLRESIITQKVYDYVTKDVTVTDDQAKQYYTGNQYSYTEKPDVMNISQIVVADQKTAQDIETKLSSGSKFEDLAKQYSTDTATKDKGGLIGDVSYTDTNYDPSFLAGAIVVPVGKVSQPIATQNGYAIVKMNSKKEYPFKSFDSVKSDIKAQLLDQTKQSTFNSKLTEWQNSAKIKTYPNEL